MKPKLFEDVPEDQREGMLEANSYDHETMPIPKYYKEDEIDEMRAEYAENSITIKRANEKLEAAKEIHKQEIKKPVDDNKYLLANIRNRCVEVEQTVYLIPDWENRMMGYYDRFGNFIKSRIMTPDERQTKIPN